MTVDPPPQGEASKQLIFDRGTLAEAVYTLDAATARRVAYDLREAADVARSRCSA